MATAPRFTRTAAAPDAAAVVLPGDVRLMNAVSAVIFTLVALGLAAAFVGWIARSPRFAIQAIRVEGELHRVNAETLRANATPRLAGNFFSADLAQARGVFEAVPWVRKAVVRRVWPDRLAVQIEEHEAAALWQGEERDDRLVNRQGEVFAANLGEVDEPLPAFIGPEGMSAQMLGVYRAIEPLLAAQALGVDELELSTRGSWRARLDTGATLELGRGSEGDLVARVGRFVRTLPALTARYQAPLEHADLRHADGYALRLRGITTAAPSASAPAGVKR